MPRGEILVGLDVGTTKVCLVIGEVTSEGEVAILGVGLVPSAGLRRGVVVDLDQTSRAIARAKEMAGKMAGVEIHAAMVGLTGEHVVSQNEVGVAAVADRERISEDDVHRVVQSSRAIHLPPSREILFAEPRYFCIDGQRGIRDPVGMSGTRLEVETHIVTAERSFRQNLEKCVLAAGITPVDFMLEPIATGSAVLSDAEMDLGVILLDIGGGTTDVALFCEGSICFTSSVGAGGYLVSRDVAVGLRTSQEEAERVKIEHGAALQESAVDGEMLDIKGMGAEGGRQISRAFLCEIIEARLEEIFERARAKLERAGYFEYAHGGVVLAGGGCLLPGTCELGSRVFGGLPVRIGAIGKVQGLVDQVQSPIHATAVGLILQAAARAAEGFGSAGIAGWFERLWASVRRLLRS